MRRTSLLLLLLLLIGSLSACFQPTVVEPSWTFYISSHSVRPPRKGEACALYGVYFTVEITSPEIGLLDRDHYDEFFEAEWETGTGGTVIGAVDAFYDYGAPCEVVVTVTVRDAYGRSDQQSFDLRIGKLGPCTVTTYGVCYWHNGQPQYGWETLFGCHDCGYWTYPLPGSDR